MNIILTFSNRAGVKVLGIDGGKAPALAQRLDRADSPEAACYAVQDAIELGVALLVANSTPTNIDPWRMIANPAHVASVNC